MLQSVSVGRICFWGYISGLGAETLLIGGFLTGWTPFMKSFVVVDYFSLVFQRPLAISIENWYDCLDSVRNEFLSWEIMVSYWFCTLLLVFNGRCYELGLMVIIKCIPNKHFLN
jgi:hypothetical protein